MTYPGEITRRQLLRRIGMTAFVAGPGAGLLSACATGGGGGEPSAAPTISASADAKNPFGVDPKKPLEVVIFSGGYGDAYAKDLHEELYKKEFPGVTVKHNATQAIGTQLRPRFISGDVPDVLNNSGPESMDLAALAAEGHLADLSVLFDAPSIDDPAKKVRDTVTPAVLDNAKIDGKDLVLNYTVSHRALWYNAKLFAARGWQLPKTWAEFTALGDTAKQEDILLFAYPGQKGPYYQLWNVLYTAAKIGGNQVLIDIDNLVDNAWNAEPMKQAVTAWVDVQAKYGDKAYFGLDHTQTQIKQLQNKLLFYPVGSWIENEMAKEIPDDFEYAIAPIPDVTAADAMPYGAIQVGVGENFVVAAKGKNPQGGLEYLRIMLSKEGARGFTEKTENLTVVNGAAEGLDLPAGLRSAARAQDAAGENIITDARFEGWYKELFDYGTQQINVVMAGRITPEDFCAKMQKKADAVKKDDAVAKQTRSQ
ncbi:carbohydrate ABC transporter, N-acetylglucosamine/diacetylchitobiose-binding protein [Nonomuraea phyllanthi]|uniref:Carbohydrate ABC transporter, N-acetylglucosamine/diacetylchitobiose-binding protein n=1 Tax=Nonomuraea phyllanthi TaxID=2219224 RepID=A0A5C4WEX6_9ACTN|nr:N-acetylglucosamine/diacetylchitobiose ABC transporter substrate-binding protein [Nonomuraea phyllanthi]KAB8193491.1 carbohydrate ABC transporter, N-acetylglucosamine/diacetylchitobiose-binding protein [Nonomuraea phyllanthi]QFY12233.1 carbohydrate ABC transporter, N-acetylglucosamine/diacetylchitobiose-binding protein [Nonomuraea phyllanthi]